MRINLRGDKGRYRHEGMITPEMIRQAALMITAALLLVYVMATL